MQALCQWEVHHEETSEALDDFLEFPGTAATARKHAAETVRTFWEQHERIDERIAGAAENWDISRISAVERNILRVAVVELSADKVPPKVAINEAIEIGREYGGEDSPRFINGVLDAVLRGLQKPARESD
jgi:N utilization substance protein B